MSDDVMETHEWQLNASIIELDNFPSGMKIIVFFFIDIFIFHYSVY